MARHGPQCEAWLIVVICASLSALAGGLSTAGAAEKETRVFKIKIDGEKAGDYQMEISRSDERTFIVKSRAEVSTSYLFIKYHYNYEGTEVWTDGRLVQLNSNTDDNGKHYKVLVQADGDMLRVNVNRNERRIRADVWTTTYWHLPDAGFRKQMMALLDCDTGKELRGAMKYVAMQQLAPAGQAQNCARYRIRGDVQVDAWYDAQERLVREEYDEDRHHITLELVRIER